MSTKPVPRGRTLKNHPLEIGDKFPESRENKRERDSANEKRREEYDILVSSFEKYGRKINIKSYAQKKLKKATITADEVSLDAVTDGIISVMIDIEDSIGTLTPQQNDEVDNFLTWAKLNGVKQTRPALADLPDINVDVNNLFNGPGRMYTNTPVVLYSCIYKYSSLIKDHFNLNGGIYTMDATPTCTGASCGGIFDWVTGRKGGTRRRNKKRKSRKSNKRTNRIR